MKLPEIFINAIDAFNHLPGIGQKSALRHCLAITRWDDQQINTFSEAIKKMQDIKHCNECGMFCDQELCSVCDSNSRETDILCVIESETDCLAIENSNNFNGVYHILGGVLNPLKNIGPKNLGIDKLLTRIKNKNIKEIILAINPSVEGDATCSYLKQQIGENIRIKRIGFGIPVGGSLEYLDSITISRALDSRSDL